MCRVIRWCVRMWNAATSMMCRVRHVASRTSLRVVDAASPMFRRVVDAASIWEADAHLLPALIAHHDRLGRALNVHRGRLAEAVVENALHVETAAAALDRLNEVGETAGS